LVATALIAGVLTCAPVARAQNDDPEALIAKGVVLRQEGKDAEALTVFRKAFDVNHGARARAQIGLAEQALGMWVKAEEDLVAALGESADPYINRYRVPLESALTTVRGRLGSLEVVVNVPEADVLVDGMPAFKTATGAIRVEAGTRTVTVKSNGYHSASRSVVVPGGGVARETFELAVVGPGERGEGEGAGGSGRPPNDGSSQRLFGWTLLGGGALVALGGVAAQIARASFVHDYNADVTCPGENSPAQPPQCQDRISSARTWQTVEIIGYAVGGALAIAGATLLITAPRAPAPKPTARASGCGPRVGENEASLVCVGRF
jgi:hypothetical protein